MPFGETIVALATPQGQSALAIVRLSGPDCRRLARECLSGGAELEVRKAALRSYLSLKGDKLDELVACYYESGYSFTGEDSLELSCHGNPLIVQRLIEDLCARGCRLAEAGEFTRTAFLNDRMDLAQAEAVADLIHARSERALAVARQQLAGSLGKRVEADIDRLLRVQAAIEAYIDFPEEDLPTENQSGPLHELAALAKEFDALIQTSRYQSVLSDGLSTVIVGPPNAGKSSLLNLLVGDERAIVSAEPGTTRDFISERIMAGPYALKITDTAGIHGDAKSIEALGIEKTLQRLASADFIILVLDSTVPSPTLPETVLSIITPDRSLVLENKVDLQDSQVMDDFLPEHPHVRLSALTGEGLEAFREKLIELLELDAVVPGPDSLVVNTRHAGALTKAKDALDAARAKLQSAEAIELAAADIRMAVEALGEIVGKIDNEAMLDRLFATFCIGK